MSTITNQRQNIFSEINSAIKSLFSSGIDIEVIEEDIKLPDELENALKELSVKEKITEQPINVEEIKKKGFGKKINPNTEKAMRAMHKEIKEKDIEREER